MNQGTINCVQVKNATIQLYNEVGGGSWGVDWYDGNIYNRMSFIAALNTTGGRIRNCTVSDCTVKVSTTMIQFGALASVIEGGAISGCAVIGLDFQTTGNVSQFSLYDGKGVDSYEAGILVGGMTQGTLYNSLVDEVSCLKKDGSSDDADANLHLIGGSIIYNSIAGVVKTLQYTAGNTGGMDNVISDNIRKVDSLSITDFNAFITATYPNNGSYQDRYLERNASRPYLSFGYTAYLGQEGKLQVNYWDRTELASSGDKLTLPLYEDNTQHSSSGATEYWYQSFVDRYNVTYTNGSGAYGTNPQMAGTQITVPDKSISIAFATGKLPYVVFDAVPQMGDTYAPSFSLTTTRDSIFVATADIDTAFPSLNADLRAQLEPVYKNAVGETVADVGAAPYGIYTVSMDTDGMTYPRQLKNPSATAQLWHTGPMTAEQAPIRNVSNSHRGNSVSAVIPVLEAAKAADSSLSYEVWYESMDQTAYPLTQTAPAAIGTYNVYVKNLTAHQGQSYEASWAATDTVLLGTMLIADAGITVSVDSVLQTSDFSIHYTKDGQEQTANMSDGSIGTADVPNGATVDLYYKTAKILTEENFDPGRLYAYDLASLSVYSALDSGLAFGGTAPVSTLSNVSEKDMILRYFVKRGTKLSGVITGEPSIVTYSKDQGGTKNVPVPFHKWVDASDPDKPVQNDAVIGTDVTAIAASYQNERWSKLTVGDTYYLYTGSVAQNVGAAHNFTPFIYGGTINSRRDVWLTGYLVNANARDTIMREMFISEEVYEKNWANFGPNGGFDLMNFGKTCDSTMGYGQYLRLPMAGTYAAGSSKNFAIFTQSMGGSGVYQTNQPWNDRTQLYTKLGSAAAVKHANGEFCWDKNYADMRSAPLAESYYTASSGIPTKGMVSGVTYGIRLVMEIANGQQIGTSPGYPLYHITSENQINMVNLELGEYAADPGLTSMTCVLTTQSTDSYTFSVRPTQAASSMIGFTTEANGAGTYYALGAAIPSSVTTLYATGWKALTEADCAAKGLDTSYAGYYPLYTPQDFARASTMVDNSDSGAKFIVMSDIDFQNAPSKPIGNTAAYTGTLDGNFHVLRNVNISASGNAGLVGKVGNGAVVRCIGIESGTITLTGDSGAAGAIVGGIENRIGITVSIEKCWADTGVTVSCPKDNVFLGGLCGYGNKSTTMGKSLCNITDSYFLGVLTGSSDYSRKLFVAGAADTSSMTNCFAVFAQNVYGLGGAEYNTYYSTLKFNSALSNTTTEQFASGEVAWKLNTNGGEDGFLHRGMWSQGEEYPMLAYGTHKPAYRVTFSGDGVDTVYAYSNVNGNVAIPASVAGRTLTCNSAAFTANTQVTADINVTVGAAATQTTDAPVFSENGAAYTMQGSAPKNAVFTLGAAPTEGTNYAIYSAETGGTLRGTVTRNGTTLTVTLNSAPTEESTIYYIAAQEGSKAESTRIAVTCNLKPLPVFNTAITDVTATCGDDPITWANILATGDGIFNFKSSNAGVAEVDTAGTLTIGNAGTATITVTVAEGTTNRAAAFIYTVTVNPKNVSENRAAIAQSVIESKGAFTAPTGFDGLTGTLTYGWSSNTGKSYEDAEAYLKTLAKGATAAINYSYTAGGNYTGTITGTINVTIIGLAFEGDGLTVSAAPVYGSIWSDILTLEVSGYSAKLNNETISGSYRVQVKTGTGDYMDMSGSTIPAAESYGYRVLFNSTDLEFTDIVVTSGSVTVAQRVVELIWSSTTLTYNGSLQAPAAEVSNKVGADVVTVTVIGAETGIGSDYTATANSLEGTAKNNYKLPDTKPVQSFSIVPATSDLLWEGNGTQSITYTGNAAAITEPTVTLVNGEPYSDPLSYSYKAQGSMVDYTSGLPSDVGIWLVKAHMTASGNYAAADSADMTLNITPAALTVTGVASTNRVYDGTAAVAVSGGTLSGILNDDDVTLVTTGATGTMDDPNAGSGKPVTITGYGLSGTKAANYTITQPADITVNISKATIMVKADDVILIKGASLPATYTATYTGFVDGDTRETVVQTEATLACAATDSNTVATYPITPSGGVLNADYDANYQFSYVDGTLSIVDKTLIMISGLSAPTGRIYNGSTVTNADFGIPVLTPDTYNSENLTYTYYDGSSASGTSIPAPKDAGTYTVRIAVAETDGDFAGYCDITFTIDKATVTVTADNKSMITGDTLPIFTVSYTGIASGDTAESIFTTPSIASCEADGNTEGNYPISAAMPVLTEAAASNYTVAAAVSGTLTVNDDTTAPEVSFGTDGNETWSALAASTVTVTDAESGVDPASLKYAWSTDTDEPSSGWSSFTNGDTLTKSGSDGDWYLHIRAADTFGNVTNAVSGRFRLDNTASTVLLLSPQGTNVPVSVSDIVLGFSEGVSGVENKKVTVSDGTDMYIYTIGASDNNISVTDSVYRAAIPVEWFVKDTEPLILEYDTEYTIELEAGAYVDTAGNGEDSGDIGSFRTEKESYTVTFKDWDDTVLSTQTVIDGSKATAPANPVRAGYSFAGWYADKAYTALFDFNTAITGDQTVYAKWTKVDSDNKDSDKKNSGKRASTTVPAPAVTPRINAAAEVSIPKATVEADRSSRNALTLTTPIASISFDAQSLDSIAEQTASEITFSVSRVDPGAMSEAERKLIGERPLYDFSITSDGRTISQFGGTATVSIPYKPTAEELKDPEHITIWHIDGSGKVVPVPSGRYDAASGTVTFTTTHFSKYAVVYVQKSFSDLENTAWARKQIEVLASKGIMEGRTGKEFAPQAGITRAEYIAALVRALGVTAKTETCFEDVAAGSRYYEEIAIAKKLGISNGSGNNCFRPEDTITRQDMLVLTERALRSLGKLSSTGVEADLERFTDRVEVKDYAAASIAALVKEGLIEGSSGRLNVKADTTRAEAAVFLHRLYNRQ